MCLCVQCSKGSCRSTSSIESVCTRWKLQGAGLNNETSGLTFSSDATASVNIGLFFMGLRIFSDLRWIANVGMSWRRHVSLSDSHLLGTDKESSPISGETQRNALKDSFRKVRMSGYVHTSPGEFENGVWKRSASTMSFSFVFTELRVHGRKRLRFSTAHAWYARRFDLP